MPTYDLTIGNAAAGRSAVNEGHLYKEELTVDFSAHNVLSTDLVKLFNIPAYHVPLHVSAQVITQEGATATGEVGLVDNADAFIDAVDLNAAAGTIVKNTGHADEAGIGTISNAARGIYLDPGHDLDTAVMKFVAVFLDMSGISASLI
jgi:hypothetical protein